MVSCESASREEFSQAHDHFKLLGQDNERRYVPFEYVCVRVHPDDSTFEVFICACAAHLAGCRVTISVPAGVSCAPATMLEELTESWAGAIEFIEETDSQLAARIRNGHVKRVRYAAPARVPLEVLHAGNEAGGCVISEPVSGQGRLEMLRYLREQSLSTEYHRYGNLGPRANEPRAGVL